MSGLPIFADPSTAVVYHPVPAANASGGNSFGARGYAQQQLPPTVAMMVVQNNPQQRHDSLSSIPLPPGMEIVLGDKTYKIQYQSYEMTREKATEYIAKCTGTPYSRMSAPPDPKAFYRTTGGIGASRSEGSRGLGETSLHTAAADPMGQQPAALPTGIVGDGEARRMPSTSAVAGEKYNQRLKTPDEVYTTIAPAASGLTPSEITRGASLSQQHHLPAHLPKVPEQQTTIAPESNNYQAPAYAPPPKDANQQQQNLGYFWEDGVWKVWQADSGKGPSNDAAASSKLPAPPQPSHQPQAQQERTEYQYPYQYQYPQQHQAQQAPLQQSLHSQVPSLVATNDQSSYLSAYAQAQQHPTQPSIMRGPPPQPSSLLQRHGGTESNTDHMPPRYMI